MQNPRGKRGSKRSKAVSLEPRFGRNRASSGAFERILIETRRESDQKIPLTGPQLVWHFSHISPISPTSRNPTVGKGGLSDCEENACDTSGSARRAVIAAVLAAAELRPAARGVRRCRHPRHPVHRPGRGLGGRRRRRRSGTRSTAARRGSGRRPARGPASAASTFSTPYTGWAVGRHRTARAAAASVGVMLRTTDGGLTVGGDGRERAAGAARGAVLRREERLRLRRRQRAFPSGMFTTATAGRPGSRCRA